MKSIEEVDRMKPSKLRHELRTRGYDHDQVLRDKLKDLMKKEEETKSTAKEGEVFNHDLTKRLSDNTTPGGVFTRSQFKDHLQEVVEDEEDRQHKRKYGKEVEERAKDLMKMKNSLPEAANGEEVKDAETFDVEEILDVEITGRRYKKRKFLIRWRGYASDEDLWVDESNLDLPIEEYELSEKAKGKLNG